ncbi:MAG: NUDIX hydrolase [Ilumatobacteraceae bacterium]
MSPTRRTVQKDFYVYVDTVVFTINQARSIEPENRLEVLVMRRPGAPEGRWALPGGLVDDREPLEDTALRKVAGETGIKLNRKDLIQVGAYGDPDRDSRWRAFSIAYLALLPHPGELRPDQHSEHAEFVRYRDLRQRGVMEFDHRTIIRDARKLAARMLEDTSVAISFCKPKFTISELRGVYEAFLQNQVDPANFRRKVEKVPGFVEPLEEYADFGSSPGRPAQMYRAGRGLRSSSNLSVPIRFRTDPSRRRD